MDIKMMVDVSVVVKLDVVMEEEVGQLEGEKHKYFPNNGHITPVKSNSEFS